jgi:cobalt-zinc-cadmium efflux system membrane fusion protein
MIRRYAWIVVVALCGALLIYMARHSDARAESHNRGEGTASPSTNTVEPNSGTNANANGSAALAISIPTADQQQAGISLAPVEMKELPRVLTVAGQVAMDEGHTSNIGVIADGTIMDVSVLPGAIVRRGQVLGALHSHLVHETVGALAQAYAAGDRARGAVIFAQQEKARYSHLYSIKAASLEESQRADQDLLQAQNQLLDAQASVRMEREHLSELLQVAPESLTRDKLYDQEIVPIRSATDGVVISRNVSVGQVVKAGDVAFVVTNLSTVWITAAVNEHDLALVHAGEEADATTQGYPDAVFHGRVTMVGDTLDPQTRTVPVRIVVPNPGTRIRPGMFASVRIAEPLTTHQMFVPEDALQEIGGKSVVFVSSDGTHLHAQAVTTGMHSGGQMEVVNGLQPGDRIVVNGSFMVKSEMLKGTMSED